MKKSSVITLIFGILLLVIGLALTVGDAYMTVPHAYYHHGPGYFMYSMRYTVPATYSGTAMASFGHLVFDSGLVMMVIFTILQVHNHKEEKNLDDKAKKADFESMKKAKAEAVDAEVHEADSSKE